MKNLVLTVIAAFTLTVAAQAQTYKGSQSGTLAAVQLSPGEFGYYVHRNDSLIVYDSTMASIYTMSLDTQVNRIAYVSRNLFDQDNEIEFLLVKEVGNYDTEIEVYDGSSFNALPNLTLPNQASVSYNLRNTSSNAELIVYLYDYTSGFDVSTYVYDLVGNALLVKEQQLEEQSLYPNPSTEIVNVPATPGEVVSVYSIDGQLLKQEQVNSRNHVMHVEDLTNGTYLIRSSNGGNWKLIKD